MVTQEAVPAAPPSAEELLRRLEPLLSPAVDKSIRRLWRRYRKHAVPVDEVRAELDSVLGSKTLTEELYRSRGK